MRIKRYSIKDYAIKYNTNRMRIYRLIRKGRLDHEKNKDGFIRIKDTDWNKGVI